ncbi:heme/hemin ABC transporter substrate-binding protein [Solicola sp. PLA-1-18]|uniref:heme/hemin ABC transporter substrate-binding protein n=1 Tax=Solicola sp. PLA-1-18 TaxID=3380532 RepID=UPI003B77EE8E
MPVTTTYRRRSSTVLAAALLLLTASGCGELPTPGRALDAEPLAGGAATRLADATPLADPAAYEGPTTATLDESPIEPVTTGEQRLPARVTDEQGTEVVVDDTSRILALDLYGSLSRTVFELGLGDRVVGRDTSSTFPEIADLPLVTHGGHELSAESVLELAPTVIVTDTSLGPWDVVLQMRDAGIPVVVVDSTRDLDTVGSLTMQVATALGVPEAGRELAQRAQRAIDATLADVRAVAPPEGERLRMVFLYVRGQASVYYMFGQGSGADSLVTAIGGHDVTADIDWKGMKPVNDEGLVAAQPDVVLMMSKGLESVGGVDGLLEKMPAIAQTPAGQKRRIVDMSDTQVLSFGPRTADVVDALARAVYAPEPTP